MFSESRGLDLLMNRAMKRAKAFGVLIPTPQNSFQHFLAEWPTEYRASNVDEHQVAHIQQHVGVLPPVCTAPRRLYCSRVRTATCFSPSDSHVPPAPSSFPALVYERT